MCNAIHTPTHLSRKSILCYFFHFITCFQIIRSRTWYLKYVKRSEDQKLVIVWLDLRLCIFLLLKISEYVNNFGVSYIRNVFVMTGVYQQNTFASIGHRNIIKMLLMWHKHKKHTHVKLVWFPILPTVVRIGNQTNVKQVSFIAAAFVDFSHFSSVKLPRM